MRGFIFALTLLWVGQLAALDGLWYRSDNFAAGGEFSLNGAIDFDKGEALQRERATDQRRKNLEFQPAADGLSYRSSRDPAESIVLVNDNQLEYRQAGRESHRYYRILPITAANAKAIDGKWGQGSDGCKGNSSIYDHAGGRSSYVVFEDGESSTWNFTFEFDDTWLIEKAGTITYYSRLFYVPGIDGLLLYFDTVAEQGVKNSIERHLWSLRCSPPE